MLHFSVREGIFIAVFFANLVQQGMAEPYIDGAKSLKRDFAENGVSYANFAVHKFRYLNLTALSSAPVKGMRECGKLCVDYSSCFSVNVAAFHDGDGWILCELLPSDRYNNSKNFIGSAVFHHLSIKVSNKILYCGFLVSVLYVIFGYSVQDNYTYIQKVR